MRRKADLIWSTEFSQLMILDTPLDDAPVDAPGMHGAYCLHKVETGWFDLHAYAGYGLGDDRIVVLAPVTVESGGGHEYIFLSPEVRRHALAVAERAGLPVECAFALADAGSR